jgi:hypothetical protein
LPIWERITSNYNTDRLGKEMVRSKSDVEQTNKDRRRERLTPSPSLHLSISSSPPLLIRKAAATPLYHHHTRKCYELKDKYFPKSGERTLKKLVTSLQRLLTKQK